MHAIDPFPRPRLTLGLLAVALALLILAAAGPDLGTLDFSVGLGSGGEAPTAVQAAPAGGLSDTPPTTAPWVTDPLAAPLETIAPAGR